MKKRAFLGILATCSALLGSSIDVYASSMHICNITESGVHEVVVPYDGEFEFSIKGASGGNSSSYAGGAGGEVVVSLELKQGDVLTVSIGDSMGTNGGGIGTVSNGGGYSSLSVNGEEIVVAGGGGGATEGQPGGIGGTQYSAGCSSLTTTNGKDGMAGGGAGYIGGISGYYEVLTHTHEGDTTNGGACYATEVYHQHTGSSENGGGCYGKVNYHTHAGDCYTWGYGYYGAPYQPANSNGMWAVVCNACGATQGSTMAGALPAGQQHCTAPISLVCTKPTTTIESYSVNCGLEGTVEGYSLSCNIPEIDYIRTQSQGGFSYCDTSKVTSVTFNPGVNNDDTGSFELDVTAMNTLFYDNIAPNTVYFKNVEVKKVYWDNQLVFLK